MGTQIIWLFLISLVSLIAGLIKPSLVGNFLNKEISRKRILGYLGGLTVLLFVLVGVTNPASTQVASDKEVKGLATAQPSVAATPSPSTAPSPISSPSLAPPTVTPKPVATVNPTVTPAQSQTVQPQTDSGCGTYVNSAGNTVQSPCNYSSAPAGATAKCGDGTYSFSQSRRGTCSGHGGVSNWL